MRQKTKALIRFEILLMKKSVLLILMIGFSCFFTPLIIHLTSGNTDTEQWIFLLHIQMFFTILLLPLIYSFLYDDEKQKMISSVIVPKLYQTDRYFHCKSCVLWGVICLIQFISLALICVIQWLNGRAQVMILLPLTAAGIATIAFSVQVTVILSLLLRKQIYVTIIMIVYLFSSMNFNVPYISIWFNPDWITSNFFTWSFAFGRLFLFLIAWVLMRVSNHVWMARVS